MDPQFEVDHYIEAATHHGMTIEAVVDTHVHADHRSGARALAAKTGATIYLHRDARVAFAAAPLDDASEISLGNVILRTLHTPGHSPESISLLVIDRTRGEEPWAVLTGDTLFVGDVGRPDFGGPAAAAQLYASLHERLLRLPDYVEVYPGHISGSPCGRAMSGKPSSTVGFERRHNAALLEPDQERFVTALFADVPPKPPGFHDTVAFNRLA